MYTLQKRINHLRAKDDKPSRKAQRTPKLDRKEKNKKSKMGKLEKNLGNVLLQNKYKL